MKRLLALLCLLPSLAFGGPAEDADFASRCGQPGVLRCISFDTPASVAKGAIEDAPSANVVAAVNQQPVPNNQIGGVFYPGLDTSTSASGAGSLRITSNNLKAANHSGHWTYGSLGPEPWRTAVFGANTDYWIQYRMKFSPEFGAVNWTQAGGTSADGPKISIQYGIKSCQELEISTQNVYSSGYFSNYANCGGTNMYQCATSGNGSGCFSWNTGTYPALGRQFDNAVYTYGPALTDFWCLRDQESDANCPYYAAHTGVWWTFTHHVTIKAPGVLGSKVETWISRGGGEGHRKVTDFTFPWTYPAGQGFSNIRFTLYQTGRGASGTGISASNVWYDELIVSTLPIPFPNTATAPTPSPTVSLTVVPASLSVASGTPVQLNWNSTNANSCTASGGWSGARATSGTITTGALTATTTFTLICDGPGGSGADFKTVTVTAAAPAVTISANPTSVAYGTQTSLLTWSTTNATACTSSNGTGTWTSSTSRPTAGAYTTSTLTAATTFTLTCTGPGGSGTGGVVIQAVAAPPVVTLIATTPVASGGTSPIAWDATGLLTGVTPCVGSGGHPAWPGAKAATGSTTSSALTTSLVYTLACTGPGGTTTVNAPVTVTAAATTVDLRAVVNPVLSGTGPQLVWYTTNATTPCTASDGWSGTKDQTSGSTEAQAAITTTRTYTLSCNAVSDSVTVTVTAPPTLPSVTLTASPTTIAYGASSTLTWATTGGLNTCSWVQGKSGAAGASGSISTGALTATRPYAIACYDSVAGTGEFLTGYATVTVTPLPSAPVITLTATPGGIVSGENSTIAWSATNTPSSCTKSNGWSGSAAASGSELKSGLTATTTYTLACTNAGGTDTESVTVTVATAPPLPTPQTVTLTAAAPAVFSGGSTTLNWSTTGDLDVCIFTAGIAGATNRPTSGTVSTGNLTTTRLFTIACYSLADPVSYLSASVTVNVIAILAPPVIALTATPGGITSGADSTIAWSVSGAPDSCTKSNGWSGSAASSGSELKSGLTATVTYTLTCSNAGGSADKSVTVTVNPVPGIRTATLSAASTVVVSGSSTTLTWSTTGDLTSCNWSGAYGDTTSASGTRSTGAMDATITYTISCYSAGAPTDFIVASVRVNVVPVAIAPVITLTATPGAITSGGDSTIAWNVTNTPTSCTKSGGWSGSAASSGSELKSGLTGNVTYTLACSNAAGSDTKSITVTVAPAPPARSVTLSTTTPVLYIGRTATLTWVTLGDLNACTWVGAFSNATVAADGSQVTAPLYAPTTFTISCYNTATPSATLTASVTITTTTTQPRRRRWWRR